jgi:hypothetical protein
MKNNPNRVHYKGCKKPAILQGKAPSVQSPTTEETVTILLKDGRGHVRDRAELPKQLMETVQEFCRKRHWSYSRFFNAAMRELLDQVEREGRVS